VPMSQSLNRMLLPGLALVLFGAAWPVAAQSPDLDFTLTNNSTFTVAEFYTSPATIEGWGDNVLAGGVLEPGGTGTVTISQGGDQCLYDMKFVFAGGDEFIDTAIDLCATGEYALSNL
jgi:hypothetical protein